MLKPWIKFETFSTTGKRAIHQDTTPFKLVGIYMLQKKLLSQKYTTLVVLDFYIISLVRKPKVAQSSPKIPVQRIYWHVYILMTFSSHKASEQEIIYMQNG